MSNSSVLSEHSDNSTTKEIWKITAYLSILTIIELALGFWMMGLNSDFARFSIKGIIVVLMIAKAFYIVAYFMHLKHEVRNLIMTIIVPLFLFVWFITAFLYEGNSYKNLRNSYDPYKKAQSSIKVSSLESSEHESHHAD